MSDEKKQEAYPEGEFDNMETSEPAAEKEADGSLPLDGPDLDSSKVKFINGGADAHVDMPPPTESTPFVGMSKEELMKYANDPYWVRVRWVILILFWLAWFAMLAAAIVIIVLAPKCPPRPKLEWWQKSVAYQIYPRSFQDTDGNGIGDIKGIEQHLEYLHKQLNVSAVWLNPVYPSPDADFGFDVSNYKEIHPELGTMADFDSLRLAMHKKNMKLIMDFVPNHTSRNHTWFQESRKNKNTDNEYKDYYVWHPGKNGGPPNNWVSVFGGPAWTFDDQRQEFYLHNFLPEQPDLNLANPKVKEELKNVLRFWLDKGVDGFRVDAAAYLFENANLTNEPASSENVSPDDYKSLDHTMTTFQPRSYEIVTEWRELLDEYSEKTEKKRFMVVEVYGTPNETQPFYEYQGKKGADMPFNMNLINLNTKCGGQCVANLVSNWMSTMPAGKWANWVLGNHDNSRVASRVGEDMVNAANMLLLTLPGTPFVYYGDEIGMVDGDISWEDTKDTLAKKMGQALYKNYSRDPERTPMQWNDSPMAGFTKADKAWLPVNPDYPSKNVKTALAHGAGVTGLEVFSKLSLLRQEPSFQWGEYHEAVVNDNIFSYVRQAEGFPGYLIAINFGSSPSTVGFHGELPKRIPDKGIVAANTANFKQSDHMADYKIGNTVNLNSVLIRPSEGFIVSWGWDDLPEQNE